MAIFETLMMLLILPFLQCHLIGDKGQISQMKKLCEHAYICVHDTIPVCGKSVNEARTFLDLCDLYEYACEHNMVFRHVVDEIGVCPNAKDLAEFVG